MPPQLAALGALEREGAHQVAHASPRRDGPRCSAAAASRLGSRPCAGDRGRLAVFAIAQRLPARAGASSACGCISRQRPCRRRARSPSGAAPRGLLAASSPPLACAAALALGLGSAGLLSALAALFAALALALGGALGEQLDRLLEAQLLGVVALAQARVVAPVPDVGPVAALVQRDRLAVLGVLADLAQLLGRGALPAAGLGEQRHRAVHADRQHVVVGAEADEAVVLDVGAVAVDAGLDRRAALGMAADLARQREQRERGLEVEIGGLEAGRQRGALEAVARRRAGRRARTAPA